MSEMYKKFMGRPTKYYDGIIEDLFEYIQECLDTLEGDGLKISPSIKGFALRIMVNESTVHEWIKNEKNAEFSKSIKILSLAQYEFLSIGGNSKVISERISMLMLGANHGVTEKKEVDLKNNGGSFSDIDTSKLSTSALKEIMGAKK